MIQLQRLEGFYWVARSEGYARAARAFPYPITQPGVHQQVKRLESELGVRLFERVGKDRVVLTPQGRALYDYVAPFYEGLPGLERSLRSGEVGGRLRIHASGHTLLHLLPPWLRRLQGQRPDIEVALFEAKVPAVSLVRSGEADLLVDHLPEVPADLEVRQVGRTRAFLCIPSNHRLARKGAVSPEPFGDEPFITYSSDPQLRELQLAALAHFGVVPRRMYAADSSETILGFVAAGLGYSLLASLLPRGPRVPGVVAWPLTEPAREFPIYAAWRKGKQRDPLIDALLELAPKPSSP
ncbi:LysR family transcriptional regulator [Archangium violaceum]|uniref:LysR family transcriptional regulator n=1 Tax=Archangium violaceum TaxID=83451 RepID=UPI00195177AF|nr:LysR family transcriptional regulator [Archangium violaceum]QRN96920.1 LysR family transcriptional regulator [Archangium violaceum]